MCNSSKQKTSSSSTTNQTATQTPNVPTWIQQPWQSYADSVSSLMASGEPIIAGASDLQNQAFTGAANLSTPTLGGQSVFDLAGTLGLNAGTAGANTATASAPVSVSAYDPAMASSRNITDLNLNDYLNAGLGDQISAAQADYDATAGQTRAQQSALAALNGGRRNSGNDIRAALTEGELSRAANTGLATIRANAYDQAGQLATADLDREAGTSQFNASSTNDALAQALGLQTQAGLDYAGRQDATSQFNAGQQDNALTRSLQAAGLLGDLGDSMSSNERANLALQAELGGTQRDITNQTGDAAQLAALQALLAGIPINSFTGQTTTGNSTTNGTQTTTSNPSLLSTVGQGASTAASLAALFSDRRLKADIEPIHKDGRGRQWYSYRYLWDAPETRHQGVMAQEILESDPSAVTTRDGFYMVDYSKLESA